MKLIVNVLLISYNLQLKPLSHLICFRIQAKHHINHIKTIKQKLSLQLCSFLSDIWCGVYLLATGIKQLKRKIEVVFPLFVQVMPGLWLHIKFSFGWESVDFFRNFQFSQSKNFLERTKIAERLGWIVIISLHCSCICTSWLYLRRKCSLSSA